MSDLHSSALPVNAEKAPEPGSILNPPELKAARLPVLAEDTPTREVAVCQPTADPEPVTAPDPAPVLPPDPETDVMPEPEEPTELVPQPATLTPPRKRRLPRILLAAAAVAALAVGLCLHLHFDSYQDGMRLATLSHFHEARDAIFLDGLVSLHDPEFADYLDGGARMLDGDYDGARALLAPLAKAGYQNCTDLLREIDYRQGCDALDREDLPEAIRYLEPVAAIFYKDSFDLYCEARISRGLELVTNLQNINSVTEGLLLLSGVAADGYPGGQEAQNHARELLYSHGVSLYEKEQPEKALEYFSLTNGFGDTDKYITLCYACQGAVTLEELWAIRGFANAEELLLDDFYLCEFLLGNWKTANGNYYFKMEANTNQYAYYCSYNLPWQYSGDFTIEEGVYMVYHNGGSARSEFRISINDWNQINIYCFKNGSTYTLYRK